MRDYEVVYIFISTLTTEEIEARLESYHKHLLGSQGSEITAVEHWGKRQLAYPIDRNENGYYVVTQFTASPSVLPEFERALKLDDDLLRHLVVLSEGELTAPVPFEVGGATAGAEDADEYRDSDKKRTSDSDVEAGDEDDEAYEEDVDEEEVDEEEVDEEGED